MGAHQEIVDVLEKYDVIVVALQEIRFTELDKFKISNYVTNNKGLVGIEICCTYLKIFCFV